MTNHDELCEKDKEIKELRTRVADQEKEAMQLRAERFMTASQLEMQAWRKAEDIDRMRQRSIEINKELQTRLSTLKEKHDCLKHNYRILDEKREIGIDYATKEIDRLTIRLSTLEQSILDLSHPNIKNILSELNQYKSKTVNVVAFHKLEDRLSTLLKASEGMEKALEFCATPYMHKSTFAEDIAMRIYSAKTALADFRAVKEGK